MNLSPNLAAAGTALSLSPPFFFVGLRTPRVPEARKKLSKKIPCKCLESHGFLIFCSPLIDEGMIFETKEAWLSIVVHKCWDPYLRMPTQRRASSKALRIRSTESCSLKWLSDLKWKSAISCKCLVFCPVWGALFWRHTFMIILYISKYLHII